MSTTMEIAFVCSRSVTMKTALGRRILNIAGRHAREERLRIIEKIRHIEANNALKREETDEEKLS